MVKRQEGRIAVLTKARKFHRCAISGEIIDTDSFYYAITIGGSGLGSIKFPDRVKPEHLDKYWDRVRQSREMVLKEEK